MQSSPGSSSHPGGEQAESLFYAFLERRRTDPSADFGAYCAEHPAFEQELRGLRERHERAEGLLRAVGADPAQAQPLEGIGERYEVLGDIARGGMGRVLEVHDRQLDRTLAMKVVRRRPEDSARSLERRRRRLVNEAHVLGRLEHPGIVPVHEVGTDSSGQPFFTMLRVRGKDFDAVLEDVAAARDGWTATRAVGVLLRVCEAVAHAHAKGILHRDLKPSNVMVGPFGEVFVMDWGLARAPGAPHVADIRVSSESFDPPPGDDEVSSPDSIVTMEGDVLGTPSYMPPEQARGAIEEVGPRSDVYSVGAMLYHLLSGRPPYAADGSSSTPREILQAVLRGDPLPLERAAPDAARELAAVCTKAMARAPERRYPSMVELAEDLRAFLENRVVRAHASGPIVELYKWMQRHRAVVALLGALLAVVLGAAVGFAFLYRRAEGQRVLAERRLELLEQNPPGFRVSLAEIPSLSAFVEDFDDGVLDLPLRSFSNPDDCELRDGALFLRRRAGGPRTTAVGLNDSLAVIRGDFELSVSFTLEHLSPPERGANGVGVNVRRARDGVLVANVQRIALTDEGGSVNGYLAHFDNGGENRTVEHADLSGRLRIARSQGRITTSRHDGEAWIPIDSKLDDQEELMFIVYVSVDAGSSDELEARIDEIRYAASSDGDPTELSLHETFDEGPGELFVPVGDAGALAAFEGRLEIELFEDRVGLVGLELDQQRFSIPDDFALSVDYELLDFVSEPGAGLTFEVYAVEAGDRGVGVAHIACAADAPGTVQASTADGTPARVAATPFPAGRLGIRRVGPTVHVEHWEDGWQTLLTTESSAPLRVALHIRAPTSTRRALVAIDDLRLDGVQRRR